MTAPKDELETLRRTARVGHLATADRSGSPHVVPVCYAFHGTSVYSALDEKPKRGNVFRLKRVRTNDPKPGAPPRPRA